jgi:ABC-type transport system involved in cytochrome bd biosynthesis fused ATPase/permease subunit
VDLRYYLQFFVALLGLLGGLFSYILGLRIRHDILENNERLEKEISAVKDYVNTAINTLRIELTKEFGATLLRQDDKWNRLDRELSDFQAGLTDKILTIINGKYVRTELHNTSMSALQDRFGLMKELIEANMKKIEDGLDQQISDLKDRIFHNK